MAWRLAILAIHFLVLGQAGALRFEVVSIKPSAPGQLGTMERGVGTDRFTATNVTARRLIQIGYGLYDYQIKGGPRWMDSDGFDIAAKASSPANLKEMEEMVRGLLVDRFQFAFHRETREMPLYELVVSKGGAKLAASQALKAHNNARPGVVTGRKATVDFLAASLTYQLGITVVNMTGLEGDFDFDLKWTPDGPAGAGEESPSLSLVTAVQDQLGLKLNSRKGPVEILTVERMERPGGN
jgi:uncharacterized protein (TIGR03435 family)